MQTLMANINEFLFKKILEKMFLGKPDLEPDKKYP